jgi:hypothetical protein
LSSQEKHSSKLRREVDLRVHFLLPLKVLKIVY